MNDARRWLILVIAMLCGVETARAQQGDHPVLDGSGFQLHRDYFSQFPFEHIDTVTGSVLLTFTDLVLPGHGGRDLKFQRTYNSKNGNWTFGLAGYALYLVERGMPPIPPTAASGHPEIYSPKFYTADGGEHRTQSLQPVELTAQMVEDTYNWVSTDRFWRYGRRLPFELHMPDGTKCQYESDGGAVMRLKQCWADYLTTHPRIFAIEWEDPSGENPGVTVTQYFPGGQERSVVMAMTGSAKDRLPTAMTFMGKTWTYEWGTVARARPPAPVQAHWEVSRTGSPGLASTVTVRTPHGGQVEYEFDMEPFPCLDPEHPHDPLQSLVLKRRRTRDRGVTQAHEWTYDYNDACWQTAVTGPTGIVAVHYQDPVGNSPHVSWHEVRTAGGVPLQRETLTRQDLPVVLQYPFQFLPPSGLAETLSAPALVNRTVTRNGRTYTTAYQYRSGPTGPERYGDYHHPWRITESVDKAVRRITTRDYDSKDPLNGPPYVHFGGHRVGLLKTEMVSNGTEAFTKSWVRNQVAPVHEQTIHGVTTRFEQHVDDVPGQTFDANERLTQTTYSWGLAKDIIGPLYRVKRTIREDSTVTAETEGEGTTAARTTSYEYDHLFRLRRIQPPGGRNATEIHYNEVGGDWVSTTTKRGTSTSTTILDGFGRTIFSTDSSGVSVKTVYDAEGRVTYEGYPVQGCTQIPVCPESIGATIEYDELGRVTRRTNPDETFVTFVYGQDSVTTTDEEGHSTVRRFDAFGDPDDARLVSVTDAHEQTWTYTYNALGKLKTVTTPDQKQRTWQYLADTSWLEKETHPESGETAYSYAGNALGLVTGKEDAQEQTTVFEYDERNRLKRFITPLETTTITYEPQSDSRQRVANGQIDVTYRYEGPGGRLRQMKTVVLGTPFETWFSYDGNDNVTEIIYPSKRRVRMEYDHDRLTKVRDVLSGTEYASEIQYHPSGAVQSYKPGHSAAPFQFQYDPLRYRPTQITAGPLSLQYAYDDAGNVTSIADGRGSSWNQTFQYDSLDRLTQSNGPYGNIGYTYDLHGNMLTQGSDVFTYNAALQQVTRNGQAVVFDANGNVTSDSTGSYTYHPNNQMKTATVNGLTTTFVYDADDWRVLKSSSGTATYFLRDPGGRLLTEVTIDGANPPKYRDYIYAGSRLLAAVDREP